MRCVGFGTLSVQCAPKQIYQVRQSLEYELAYTN